MTAKAGTLAMRPGVHHQAESRLIAEGGGLFLAADQASIELRFQTRDG